jgi:hypothetical protein
MFDVDTETTITRPLRTEAQGLTDISVRWPTDQEWADHRRRRRVIRRDLGRGSFENEVDNADGDAKLFEAIKQNGAPPLTGAEASQVIEWLGLCNVVDVKLGAQEAEVELVTNLGEVRHQLRIPTYEEVRKLNRSTRMISLPFNRFEVRTYLEAGAELWDKCNGRGEGYKSVVPSLHKDTVIRAVIEAITQEASPRHDEPNF